MRNLKFVIVLIALAIVAVPLLAQPITRLPTLLEFASGKVCVRSTPKVDYVAWYGDGVYPDVVACTKKVCNLVATKRSVAAFFSGPITMERYNAAMAGFTEHPYKNKELRDAWVADFIANCQHIK